MQFEYWNLRGNRNGNKTYLILFAQLALAVSEMAGVALSAVALLLEVLTQLRLKEVVHFRGARMLLGLGLLTKAASLPR